MVIRTEVMQSTIGFACKRCNGKGYLTEMPKDESGETLTIDKVIPCYTLDDGDSLMIVFKGRPKTYFKPGDEITVRKK